MESASSCGPQANSQPPPPRAQAPKPTGVILISEFPSFRVSIRILSTSCASQISLAAKSDYFIFFKLDEEIAKRLERVSYIRMRKRGGRTQLAVNAASSETDSPSGFVMVVC